ncbi:MAG: hypothetical protein Q4G68_05335 [Planctomycetia bacterium]|nr:hypothetical protein [Planctomycetia bacterium]
MSLLVTRTRIFSFVLLAVGSCFFCSCKSDMSRTGVNDPYAANAPQNEAEEAYYRDVYSGEWREQTGPFGFAKSIGKKNGSSTMPAHWSMVPHGAQSMQEIAAQQRAAGQNPAQVAYNPYPGPAVANNAYQPAPMQQGNPVPYASAYQSPYQSPLDQMSQAPAQAMPNASNLPYQTTGYGSAPAYEPGAPAPYQPTYQPADTTPLSYQPGVGTESPSWQQNGQTPAANAAPGTPLPVTPDPQPVQPYQYAPVQEQNPPYGTGTNSVTKVTPAGVVTPSPVADEAPGSGMQAGPGQTPVPSRDASTFPQPVGEGSWMFQPVTSVHQGDPAPADLRDRGEPLIIRGQMPVPRPVTLPAATKTDSEAMPKLASLLAYPEAAEQAESAVSPAPLDYRRIGGQLLPLEIDPKLADAWAVLQKEQRTANPENPCPWCPGLALSRPDDCPGSEYIADGGDARGEAYVTPDWNIHYLEQEDTIAHYDTLDGKILVEPSNRVCIYSPRFGSVRQVLGLAENDQNVVLQMADLREAALTDRGEQAIDVRMQEEKTNLTRAGVLPTGIDAKVSGHTTSGEQNVMENTLETRIGDMVALLKTGDLKEADTSFLMAGTTAAAAWSELQGVEVEIDNILTSSNVYHEGAETLTYVENGTKSQKLKLVKVASKEAAAPGELIEFTLRFENVGTETIGNVTLVDNLSARLSYVANSAKSSVKAEFLSKSNDQGSLVLRWEITDPLEPGQFGVVQFLCKVR